MSKKDDKNVDSALEAWQSSRLAAFFQVTAYTVSTMFVLGGGGYLLDQQLGTYPALFMIGLIVSFPLIQFLLYKKFKQFAKKQLNKKK